MGARVVVHVAARFQGGEPLLAGDEVKALYLDLLSSAWRANEVVVHYFVAMETHSHWLVEGQGEAIADAVHRGHGAFARDRNYQLDRRGHVFQSRYQARYVDDETHLLRLVYYLAHNPVEARLVNHPWEYRWSADPAYRGRRALIEVKTGLVVATLGGDSAAYARLIDRRQPRPKPDGAIRDEFLRGLVRLGRAEVDGARLADPPLRELRARLAARFIAEGLHPHAVAKALGVSRATLKRDLALPFIRPWVK